MKADNDIIKTLYKRVNYYDAVVDKELGKLISRENVRTTNDDYKHSDIFERDYLSISNILKTVKKIETHCKTALEQLDNEY